MKQWYEKLFENYGLKYDMESFTHGTIWECDFIEQEINFNKNIKNSSFRRRPESRQAY